MNLNVSLYFEILIILFQTAILLLGILLHSKWFKCSEAQKWESESSTSLNRCHHIALKEKPESNHSKSCHKIVTKIALNEINNLNIEEATQNCINSTVSAVHEASDCPNDDAGNINHNDTASNSNDCSNLELHSVCDKTVQQHANLDLCDTEIYIGGLLLRHIQQLVCNAHAITEVKVTQAGEGTPIQETSQVRVATAIYPTASLMNHSCDPTIISRYV